MTENKMDEKEFRATLSQFATGVTVITTLGTDREPIGITASSFNSLSMDPPLILWSLGKDSYSLPAFENALFFNIHILGDDQAALSNLFARQGTDKFKNVETYAGNGGTPILKNCAALLECRTRHLYEGGDHIIVVGEVLQHSHCSGKPLIFHQGQYASLGLF